MSRHATTRGSVVQVIVTAAMALLTLSLPGTGRTQTAPLEIPFVKEWSGSPHARLTDEPFVHWNEEGEVPVECARCHSTPGFLDHIGADGTPPGVDRPAPVGTVIACVACHNEVTRRMDSVTFPSGLEVTKVGSDARCMVCHQGRESTVSVNEALKGLEPDTVSDKLRFINVHYRAAGATRFGTQAKGAYEYDGMAYAGFFKHNKDFFSCSDCHELHTVRVAVEKCAGCHKTPQIREKKDLQKIRDTSKEDFDGDGNASEGMGEEIAGLQDALYAAIRKYAAEVSGSAIAYDGHTYPYFFQDSNGNGKADPNEAVFPNAFKAWTPRLMRAAYNYQYSLKDPGVYTHNPRYVIQTLYDSLADLGRKVEIKIAGMARPK